MGLTGPSGCCAHDPGLAEHRAHAQSILLPVSLISSLILIVVSGHTLYDFPPFKCAEFSSVDQDMVSLGI